MEPGALVEEQRQTLFTPTTLFATTVGAGCAPATTEGPRFKVTIEDCKQN